MKKTLMTIVMLALALGAFAETMSGIVHYTSNAKGKKFWKLGVEKSDGTIKPIASFDRADFDAAAQYEGKQVDVTGELNSSMKFPQFLAGVQFEVIAK